MNERPKLKFPQAAMTFSLDELLKAACSHSEAEFLIGAAKEACIRRQDFQNAADLRTLQNLTRLEGAEINFARIRHIVRSINSSAKYIASLQGSKPARAHARAKR